ncbi:MAG: ABC transporter ATP-binding protein [Elusimicrobia bacterium]|nr:ABC transporter ATP-binding protein [Elusimicrobiota bacterium]
MPETALSFVGVTKTYSRSHLGRTTTTRGVEELSLELASGEIFGLLGLNGSGKTTTLKLALGLLRPSKGEVSVLGHPSGTAKALASMGYLPELPYFYPYLAPREVLTLYGRLSALPASSLPGKIDTTLEAVGLSRAADRRMAEFSKGMLQRVGLAQAILHDPTLLLLDEPVSGLDPLAIAEFRELLATLNAKGKTLVLSSHSISEVEKICHRAGILADGKLVRVISQTEWSGEPGRLEKLFVETVRPFANA